MLNRQQFATAAESRWKTVKYATTDCQAFIEVCAKEAGYTFNSRGSNDIWRNYLVSKGDTASYPLTIGDIVFKHRAESSKLPVRYQGDGLGDFYHVGIVTGNYTVCHSANSKENGKRDVFSSQAELAKVWTHAGTLKNTGTVAADTTSSTLGTVDTAAAIEKLEEVISLLKF